MNPESTPPQIPETQSTTNWRVIMELLSFTGLIIPMGHILAPLILWMVKKDTTPEVDHEGKRVLNFNISWTIWGLVTCGIGFIAWIIIAIIAAIKAAEKQPFTHPWTIQFVK